MSNAYLKIRNNDYLKFYYSLFVFLWGITGIVLLILRALLAEDTSASFIITATYFTTQSNVLITIISLLVLLGFSKKYLFKYLSFVGLINIVITCLIFHILLVPYMTDVSFLQQILHTIIPILYFGLYFIFLDDQIQYKFFWISLIHPLIFLLFVYTLIEPMFGDMFESTLGDISGIRYVYPFLDPENYERSFLGLIGFIFGILTPIICTTSLLVIYFKRLFDKKINQ